MAKRTTSQVIAQIVDSVGESLPATFDVNVVLSLLYRAAAEEVQAYYQYILPAKFLVGPFRPDVERLFVKNAEDELNDHFDKILTRLSQFDASIEPLSDLYKLNAVAVGGYIPPREPYAVEQLLQDNITGEKDAIKTYTELCNVCAGKDFVTLRMAKAILADEVEHLTEHEDLYKDVLSLRR